MKNDERLHIRIPQKIKKALNKKCESETLHKTKFLNKIIEEAVREYIIDDDDMKDLIIKNWREYVVEGTDIKKLEKDLKQDWLDENNNLVLIADGEEYRKDFWQRYDVAFHDDILGE